MWTKQRVCLRQLVMIASLAAVVAICPAAHAVDTATKAAARELGSQGVEAYQGGDFELARERLEQAYRVLRVPTLALWSARALEKTGDLLEASERYLEATRLSYEDAGNQDLQQKAQTEALTERAELLLRIPKVIVQIAGEDPEDVTVSIDGAEVPPALYEVGRPTNPGSVDVVATSGERSVAKVVELVPGAVETVVLRFQSSPAGEHSETPAAPPGRDESPHPRSWQKPTGWAAVGLGAAGLALGGVTGLVALGDYYQLKDDCPDKKCLRDSHESEVRAYNTLQMVSGASLIAGGVLVAAGMTLLLTAPKKADRVGVRPYVGFAAAGLRGTF